MIRHGRKGELGSRRGGFTLVELMVTISIIVLLVTILVPALRHARLTMRAVSCLSNLRQVGTADQVYAADFEDWITPLSVKRDAFGRPGVTGDTAEWSEILGLLGHLPVSRYDVGAGVYVPTASPVVCPDLAVALNASASNGAMGSHRGTYGHRTRIGSRSGQFMRLGDRELLAASAVPYKVDSIRSSYPQQPPLMFFEWNNFRAEWSGDLENSGGVAIHSGVMNTLFCDGHAAPVSDHDMRTWSAGGHADFYFRGNGEYVDLTSP